MILTKKNDFEFLFNVFIFVAERNQANCNGKSKSVMPNIIDGESTTSSITSSSSHNQDPTWVHEIFQGILTSETRCLNCEEVFNI